MEQNINSIVLQENPHVMITEFKNKNFIVFENIIKSKNYKYYKGTYKFNVEIENKPDFFVCNTCESLVNKYSDSMDNNILYCVSGYKNNIYSVFCCKNNINGNINNDFNIIECSVDEFINDIKPIENNNELICQRYNINL